MPAPSIEYADLSPMLIVFGVAVVGVLVEAFVPRGARYVTQVVLTAVGLAAALAAVIALAGTRSTVALGAVAVDGPALLLEGTIVVIAALSVPLLARRRIIRLDIPVGASAAVGAGSGSGPPRVLDGFTPQASTVPGGAAEQAATRAGTVASEIFPLMLFAVGGMMLFGAANDLLTMFVALEVFSLPLYLLCALARRDRQMSQEAALKYFLLGGFSSAFFLFGVAFLYGFAGSVRLSDIAAAVADGTGERPFVLLGTGLLLVGLLFKIGAVPFHYWVPDVYQGAPTPISAFMASCTKVAAFAALLRILYVALPGLADDWRPALWVVAIATMLIASIAAITQTDVKRMLAYSSVAHAGFILTGVSVGTREGLSASMFYLVAYGFSTLGAFAVVTLVRRSGREATALSEWAGLGRRSPVIGVVFALFLLAFAGIPLTSGFSSKFAVFAAAAGGGAAPLVIVGVISSAIAAVFYIRVIVVMFDAGAPSDATSAESSVVSTNRWTMTTITIAGLATVALGVAPQPLLDLADRASLFVR